jgi:L-2-amino-thiazoline-4-carboxylic acid hydrolase
MSQDGHNADRRRLLTRTLPLAALACAGCRGAVAQAVVAGGEARFLEKTGMTTEEMYAFFYGSFIPVLQALAQRMGRERFLSALADVASENTGQMIGAMVKDWPARDLRAMSALWQNLLSTPPFSSALAYEVVEQTEKTLELKFTACLPAKLLRAMNAVDIGYALECSGSKAVAKAFNPKIKVSNPKNIMKGDAYCTERYVLEA